MNEQYFLYSEDSGSHLVVFLYYFFNTGLRNMRAECSVELRGAAALSDYSLWDLHDE